MRPYFRSYKHKLLQDKSEYLMNNYIYNININVAFAKEYNLSFEHCALLKFFMMLPNRSDYTNNEWVMYYRANMKKIHEQLPLLSEKDDTVYRYIKTLIDKWLLQKLNKIDYYRVTDHWLKYELVGNKSEQPEINPILTGNKSDTVSEINPTYNNTIYNKNIIDSLDFISDDVKELFIAFVDIRKKREKWLSDIAIKNLHKELHKLSTDPIAQWKIINKSITNNRKWLFKIDIKEMFASIQKIQIDYQQEVAKDKDNKKAIWNKYISEYWSDTMQQVLDKINTSSFTSSLL